MRRLLVGLWLVSLAVGCRGAEPVQKEAEPGSKPAVDCRATYVACGCGCCGGVEPGETRCLSCANGDDLQALIDADQRAAKDPQCAVAGCSTGVKYVYCDAAPANPG